MQQAKWIVLENADRTMVVHVDVSRVRHFAVLDFRRSRGGLTTVIHIEGLASTVSVDGDHSKALSEALERHEKRRLSEMLVVGGASAQGEPLTDEERSRFYRAIERFRLSNERNYREVDAWLDRCQGKAPAPERSP